MNVNANTTHEEFFVNRCSEKIESIKCGRSKGKIWNTLKNNPIEISFKAIKQMKSSKDSKHFENFKVTVGAFERLELMENDLVEFLISKQEDPEVDEVIQKIYESKTFGLSMERKIGKCPENSMHKWERKYHPTPDDDTMFLIFSKIDMKSFGKILLTSRYYYNNLDMRKTLCLLEDNNLFHLYPKLVEMDKNKKVNWRAVSLDVLGNENLITSKNVFLIKMVFNKLVDGTEKYQLIDYHKLTPKTIKKRLVEKFKLISGDEDLLNKIVKDLISEINLSKKDMLFMYEDCFTAIGLEATNINISDSVPREWGLEEVKEEMDDDESCCQKCILF